MVGRNYIMQMTFAVLFEHIPSDVSFFITLLTHLCPCNGSAGSSSPGPQVPGAVCPDCHADTAHCEKAVV